jgi:hypothetical protein
MSNFDKENGSGLVHQKVALQPQFGILEGARRDQQLGQMKERNGLAPTYNDGLSQS